MRFCIEITCIETGESKLMHEPRSCKAIFSRLAEQVADSVQRYARCGPRYEGIVLRTHAVHPLPIHHRSAAQIRPV
jgi:hypothetical protein